jgi:hypothetical protein
MSIEEDLRRSLAERSGTVRTAPDDADLARRLGRVTRSSQRVGRLVQVAALVVAAGSVGGVLGAFANRPTTKLHVVSSLSHPALGSPGLKTTTRPTASSTPARKQGGQVAGGPSGTDLLDVPVYHAVTSDGLAVNWSVSAASTPLGVSLGTAKASACLSIRIVSAVVSSNGVPLAAGTGVIGLPPLQASGLAVVSSGAFGSPGKPSGWWTIVQTGSGASRVAVEFPWGEIEEATTGADGGVAVLAGIDPSGYSVGADAELASVVAENAKGWSTNSLGFLLGGGPDVAGESMTATTAGTMAQCGTAPAAAPAAAEPFGSVAGEGASFESVSVVAPPAPLVAAGAVVQAFEQAYTVNPLFGLSANLAAVNLGADLGCPSGETLAATSSVHEDGLTLPAAQVYAIDFASSTEAVVLYKEGSARAETGTAVLVNGVWKVSRTTYCQDMAA